MATTNIELNKASVTLATQGTYCTNDILVTAKLQEKTTTAGLSAISVSPDANYAGLSKVTINPTPSGSKTTTVNGTVNPDSGKLLSSVVVNVPPYVQDVATAAEMTANLVSANVGRAYRFTGTTDNTYTNGDIYVVEG